MIRDLEALLLNVSDDSSREYLREAVRCYHASAYRAAVVLSVAAGMDDLRRKLDGLVATGGAPAPVVAAQQNIERVFKNQDPFENTLIDACENVVNSISPSEAAKLRLLLKTRHLCAHPSGHAGTAEEARSCICDIVDLVLSRPVLMGITAVESVMDRLAGPVFFPKAAQGPESVVEVELKTLHPTFYRALVNKLIAAVLAEAPNTAASGSASNLHRHSRLFLKGMTRCRDDARKTVWKYLGRVVDSPATVADALSILAFDPKGIALADALTRDRALALVRRNLTEETSRSAARGWLKENVLSDAEKNDLLAQAKLKFASVISPEIAERVAELDWPELDALFFAKAVEDTASGTWSVANTAILTIQGVSASLASRMPVELRAKYLLNLAGNAAQTSAAKQAAKVCAYGLGPRADFSDALVPALAKEKGEGLDQQRLSTDWKKLGECLNNSQRLDVVGGVLALFVGNETERYPFGASAFVTLAAGLADASIAAAAKASLDKRADARAKKPEELPEM